MSSNAANALRCRFRAGLVAFGAGLVMLGLVPKIAQLESTDRRMLSFLMGKSGAETGKVRIVGTGDYDDPRAVWGLPTVVSADRAAVPAFLAFTDDSEGLFESSPPGPADLAVVLDNLFRFGHRKLAVATPLAWENPGRVAASALDFQLGRYSPAILGMPLVRGLTPQPLPAPFERVSVPVGSVRGDVRSLPIVNQLAIPDPQFGADSTWAAFTRMENEKPPEFGEGSGPVRVPLLARWGERVVMALPLAVTMARFGVSAGEVVISPGRDIRLGETGPVIPIDEFGRAVVIPGAAKRVAVVPAEETLRAPGEAPPETLKPGDLPIVLRNDAANAPPEQKAYSRHLADILVALDRAPRSNFLSPIPRPHPAVEILIAAAFAAWVAWACWLPAVVRHPLLLAAVVGALGLSWLMLAVWRVAFPPLALLAVPLAGWGACVAFARPFRGRRARPALQTDGCDGEDGEDGLR